MVMISGTNSTVALIVWLRMGPFFQCPSLSCGEHLVVEWRYKTEPPYTSKCVRKNLQWKRWRDKSVVAFIVISWASDNFDTSWLAIEIKFFHRGIRCSSTIILQPIILSSDFSPMLHSPPRPGNDTTLRLLSNIFNLWFHKHFVFFTIRDRINIAKTNGSD